MEAEKAILGVIRAARPDDAVLGEEGGQQGASDAVRQWLVDPLCGTLNYAVGNMLVAVNVALREGAAAVADPFSGEVFFTDGETALVRRDGADARLTPTPATQLVDVNLDPPFPSAPGFRAVDLLAHPGFVERFRPRVVSTTLALAWVGSRQARRVCHRWRRPFRERAFRRGHRIVPGHAAASSPGSTALRSGRRAAGSSWPPTPTPTGC